MAAPLTAHLCVPSGQSLADQILLDHTKNDNTSGTRGVDIEDALELEPFRLGDGSSLLGCIRQNHLPSMVQALIRGVLANTLRPSHSCMSRARTLSPSSFSVSASVS
ncbi:hypothetical protein ELH90_03685 [Rhizobium leguminosarum]|uniref:Uncharacterized protein n=1 Tax=Rhizobium leguminosarum TaxID=384 RepID=A0A7M3DQC1_RHILE|nr:hypothetical protein ELH90_03685 [Rhizobium leguminosarum]